MSEEVSMSDAPLEIIDVPVWLKINGEVLEVSSICLVKYNYNRVIVQITAGGEVFTVMSHILPVAPEEIENAQNVAIGKKEE